MTRYGPGEIGRDDGILSESKRRHPMSSNRYQDDDCCVELPRSRPTGSSVNHKNEGPT